MAQSIEIQEEEQSPPPDPSDVLLCPHCVKTITPFDHFCPHCNGPVTSYASVDPLGQIQSSNHAYFKALQGKPRPIVFYGMWLIFGPQLPITLIALGAIINRIFFRPSPSGDSDFPPDAKFISVGANKYATEMSDAVTFNDVLALLVIGVIFAIYSAILWKLTRNYFKKPTTTTDSTSPSPSP
jgi:hypothetical protein